jgi:hypothetical protein
MFFQTNKKPVHKYMRLHNQFSRREGEGRFGGVQGAGIYDCPMPALAKKVVKGNIFTYGDGKY